MEGGGNGCSGGSFQDALMSLGNMHQREVGLLRQEYEDVVRALRRENQELRASLAKAGISNEETIIDSMEAATSSQRRSPFAAKASAAAPERAETTLALLPSHAEKGNGHAVNGFERRTVAVRDSLREVLIEGEFRIKEQWNKVTEVAHWGSNLDAFMVRFGSAAATKAQPRWSSQLLGKGMQQAMIATAAASQVPIQDEEDTVTDGVDAGCTIYPNSTFRLTWDLSGLVLIGYDLIAIPLNLAFTPEPNLFSMTMDWTTLLFWTADMCQGFFLGYFEKGLYVSNNKRILKHYLLTWFVPDVVVVGPEWLVTVASSSLMGADADSVGEIGKIMKGARAVRALRLLRLLKLQRIINLLYDMIESEHTFIVVNLAKLLVAVLVLNHVIACLWFLIGRVCMENGMTNWINVAAIDSESSEYKYLSALHWSLTQFTPASMDISARNIWERAFSIVVLFFAMVAFSSIVASITGSMTSLRNMKTEDMKQFWLLRRYLRQRNVAVELSDRIFKYLEHETQKQSKLLQRKSITVLQHLSVALQGELTHALNSPFLTGHPFFDHLDTNMSVVMHRLCHLCLKLQSHAEREVIFSAGEKAIQMYFVKGGGMMQYSLVDGAKLDPSPTKGDWLGEAVLWTEWRHQGELQSINTNELIVVDPNSFLEVMRAHPRPWFYAKRYAIKFVKLLNTLEPSRVIDVLKEEDLSSINVSDCDKIGLTQSSEIPNECDSHSDSAEFSMSVPGDAKQTDEPDENSGRYSGGTSVRGGCASVFPAPPARRGLGLCPCGVGLSCEPWPATARGRR